MTKNNILYIDHYPNIAGGQQSLLTRLKYIDREKFKPVVICPIAQGDFHKKLVELGVITYKIKMNKKIEYEGDIHKRPLKLLNSSIYVIKSINKIIKIIEKEQIDIIHPNTFKAGILSIIASKFTNVPVIFHARSSRYYSSHGWLDDIIFNNSYKIIANSEFTKKSFSKWEKKIQIIYSGIDFEEFSINNKKINSNNIINASDKNIIGFIARISPRKRLEDVLYAAKDIVKLFPNTIFFIVGEYEPGHKDYYLNMKKLTKSFGLSKNITFCGYRDDIPSIINLLDILVLPAVNEPLGRVIIESLFMRTPVIGSDSGGIPEIILPNETGLLVPPKKPKELAKAIYKLIKDKKYATKLAIKGQKYVKRKFSANIITKQEEKLYLKVISDIGSD